MPNPKLEKLQDNFTAATINTTLWNANAGSPTLDGVNDLVVIPQPTVNGTINMLGTSSVYDATGSYVYAEVGPSANGNGGTRTEMKLQLDTNNLVTMRLAAGVFGYALKTGGTTVTTSFTVSYDPNAHGWWRIREAGAVFFFDASADSFTWTNLASTAYTWSATGVTFALQVAAQTTEVAGNAATIQHINTQSGGPFNFNWPLLEEGWGARWASNGADSPLDQYVNLTLRTQGQSTVSRGRQYELDQVQAGTAAFTAQNKDGVLDPDNAAGPFAGHIQPAQPYRKRAQWPQTRNLLSQTQATAGDLGGQALGTIDTSNHGPSIFSGTDTTHGSFVSSASAWQGGTVMQFAVPSGTVLGKEIVHTPQAALIPGQQYTGQIQARNVTASTTVQVWAYMATFNAARTPLATYVGSAATLTGGAAPVWTPLTVTATIDANAAYVRVGLMTAATAAATCSVQVDGWQLEHAPVASTWCCPGVWYPWYSGFTDAWDAEWTMGGTYGTVTPTTYDAFALLSQKKLLDALTMEITRRNPRFLYQLDDPAGSTGASDATGQNPAAPVLSGKYGSGSAAFGTAITAANPTTGIYTGSSDTVLTFNNPNPGANGNQGATFLSLSAAGIKGPANPQLWTRMVAFRYTGPTPTWSAEIWSAMDGAHQSGSTFSVYVDSTTKLAWSMSGPTGGSFGSSTTFSVVDSNWHLVALTFDAVNTSLSFYCDGVNVGAFSPSASTAPTGMTGDVLGSLFDPANSSTSQNFKGDISFAVEFPTFLSGADVAAIYGAWKNAYTGESSNARYSRILLYAGYIGPTSVQAGLTTSMGPYDCAGQDALSALQAVVDTENGNHFVGREGTVNFQARSNRYNSTVPVYVFGENTAAGEWPYEDAKPSRDTTHLANDVEVTQTSSGQVFSASSAAAQTAYFPKTMTREINSTSAAECQDASNYLLSRYVNPVTRVQTLTLHPSANPAMWPVCLSLELGMRVRVMRRPPAAPAIQVDCFIEKIDTSNDDTGEAFWTLQCSPCDLTPYGVFASFHTTLHTTISSGVSSITINAGADSTNLAAAQIGQGQQLVLGLGTANVETVTVLAVAATSPGWTTAVITLSAATTKGHTAADVICEPLPTGITDPTTWDKVSMFDSIAFAY